jgi:hypothetical protein
LRIRLRLAPEPSALVGFASLQQFQKALTPAEGIAAFQQVQEGVAPQFQR